MHRILSRLLLSLCVVLGLNAQAAEPLNPSDPAAALLETLRARLPGVPIDRIRPTPVPGLFELVSGKDVLYVDASGRYLFSGELVDTQKQLNLTRATLNDLTRIDPKQLPLADALTIVRGSGKRHLYVFSDPDCPYCKQLEREALPRVSDVTIHLFLFPIVSLHPQAARHAVAIWCSDRPVDAWENAMLRDAVPAPGTRAADCANPVERNVALGAALGVNATPTLIFEDGKVVPGAIPAAELESLLAGQR